MKWMSSHSCGEINGLNGKMGTRERVETDGWGGRLFCDQNAHQIHKRVDELKLSCDIGHGSCALCLFKGSAS